MKKQLTLLAIVGALGFIHAGELRAGKDADPKDVPLTLTIRSKAASYKLDLGGRTAKEFKETIELGKKGKAPLIKTPAVDLEIEIANTGKERIEFWSTGDPVQLLLELKGPDAVTINPLLAFTADFRLPKLTALEPGQKHVVALKSLQSGMRGMSTWHYWLAPGEYTLTPRFKTAVRPIPPGVKEEMGAGPVTLVGKPLVVKVVE